MIPSVTVNTFIFALIFTTVVPIGLLIFLAVKKKINLKPMLFGALAFFVSQVILRMPILSILSTQEWFISFAGSMFIAYVLVLSFTAGLFEESARLGGALILKNNRSYKDAVSFGLGHGFCEVILIIGTMHINNVILSIAINNPEIQAALALTAEPLAEITALLRDVPLHHIYLGLLERVSAVILHIFATVLVFQGVVQKKTCARKMLGYYALAIAAHTAVNFAAVMLGQYINLYVSQAVLLVMAAAMGWYVLRSKKWFEAQEGSAESDESKPFAML